MHRYPSPSLVVSIVSLIVALGGAGYAATGGNFILGASNAASTATRLTAAVPGAPAVVLTNTSTTGSAALSLVAPANRPTLSVSNTVKIARLNADLLDGLNSTNFVRTGTAINAETLDGLDSTEFPRVFRMKYKLASGEDSAAITLPANLPVQLMGVETAGLFQGVGSATLFRNPGIAIGWVGLESHSAVPVTISQGITDKPGVHIIFLDYAHEVDIRVLSSNTIMIHNGSVNLRAGSVTLMY